MSYELTGPSFMQGMEPLFLISAFIVSAVAVPFITPYLFAWEDETQDTDKTMCKTNKDSCLRPEDAYIHVCFHIDGVSKKPNVYDNIDGYTNHFLVLSNVMFENESYEVNSDNSETKHEELQEHILHCRDDLLKNAMFNYDFNDNGDLYIRADASEIMYVQGFLSEWSERISSTTSVRFVFLYDDYQGMDQEQVMKYYLDSPRVMADFEYAFVNLKYMYYYLKTVSPCTDACDWYKNVETPYNDSVAVEDHVSNDISGEPMEVDSITTYTNNIFEENVEKDSFVEIQELRELKSYYKKITTVCNDAHMSQLALLWDVMSNVS